MTSVTSEAALAVEPARAWALVRAFGAAHHAFPGILASCTLDGDVRTVTFDDGTVVQERLVGCDESRQRIAYAVVGGRFSHHAAAMQVVPDGARRCRFVWTSDFLPDDAAPIVRGLMERGTAIFRATVETVA